MNRDTAANRLDSSSEAPSPQRRRFLGWLSGVGMVAGLVAAYGTLGGFLARFLYPARPTERGWMFVAELGSLRQGDSLLYRTPAGAPINITRRERGDSVDSFVALSSTCPHLGCQVTWEPQNNRFFCPCHNGVFDPSGKATEGPPADEGQALLEYPLRVADGMLFIQVPLEELARRDGAAAMPGPSAGRGRTADRGRRT